MRFATALLSAFFLFAGSGCAVVVATGVAVTAVTTASVKTAGKVTAATVTTTGRVASAALTSGGKVTALGVESAARLAQNGMVVVVDGGSGAVTQLPWRQGMQLYAAVHAAQPDGSFRVAKVFREGRQIAMDLQHRRSDLALQSRDVIELKP